MKAKSIIHSILEENAVRAKKIIAEDLTLKLGERLAEEYIRVAKQTFNDFSKNYILFFFVLVKNPILHRTTKI